MENRELATEEFDSLADREISARAGDFRRLMDAVRGGSEEAAWQLLEEYGPHVLRVVRRYLSKDLRTKFDSTDFTQTVWASFFVNRGKISEFEKPEQLVAFLVSMARNKIIGEFRRRLQTVKSNVKRECSLSDDAADHEQMTTNRQTRPSEFAMARECWHRLVDGQPDRYQQIVALRYMGNTHEEIAAQLGITERTVRRVLERLLKNVPE